MVALLTEVVHLGFEELAATKKTVLEDNYRAVAFLDVVHATAIR